MKNADSHKTGQDSNIDNTGLRIIKDHSKFFIYLKVTALILLVLAMVGVIWFLYHEQSPHKESQQNINSSIIKNNIAGNDGPIGGITANDAPATSIHHDHVANIALPIKHVDHDKVDILHKYSFYWQNIYQLSIKLRQDINFGSEINHLNILQNSKYLTTDVKLALYYLNLYNDNWLKGQIRRDRVRFEFLDIDFSKLIRVYKDDYDINNYKNDKAKAWSALELISVYIGSEPFMHELSNQETEAK